MWHELPEGSTCDIKPLAAPLHLTCAGLGGIQLLGQALRHIHRLRTAPNIKAVGEATGRQGKTQACERTFVVPVQQITGGVAGHPNDIHPWRRVPAARSTLCPGLEQLQVGFQDQSRNVTASAPERGESLTQHQNVDSRPEATHTFPQRKVARNIGFWQAGKS